MKEGFYSIAIKKPDGKVRELKIAKKFLSLSIGGILSIIFLISFSLFISGVYFQEKNSKIEINALQKRTKFLGFENRKYKEELGKLESKLDKLKVLETRIRKILHIETNKKTNKTSVLGGIGGPVVNVLKNPSLESLLITREDKFFHRDVEAVWNKALEKEEKFSTLLEVIKSKKGYPYFLAPRWPIIGAINSGFGIRQDPITGEKVYHEGVDISGKKWAPVKAAFEGKVVFSGWTNDGYGKMIVIDHGNGYITRYAHNISNLVKKGEKVRKGQIIAYIGSTGRSTGPHLHFEVRHRNVPVNPRKFFFN